MKRIINDFTGIFYPNICLICGENLLTNECQICLSCLNQIPRTNYHLVNDNPVEKRFWGKVPVCRGTSFFYFHKGSPFQKTVTRVKIQGK